MAHPKLSGRLLDLASDGEARGMVVTPKPRRHTARCDGGRRWTEFGLRLAAILYVPLHDHARRGGLARRRRYAGRDRRADIAGARTASPAAGRGPRTRVSAAEHPRI